MATDLRKILPPAAAASSLGKATVRSGTRSEADPQAYSGTPRTPPSEDGTR